MLFGNPVPLRVRLRMQPRSVTFDRMVGILQNASGNPVSESDEKSNS